MDDDIFADPDAVIPGIVWWAGPVTCSICGHRYVAVIPIDEDHDEPIVPMECSDCGNATVSPDDDGD